jgi:hypothetical protein
MSQCTSIYSLVHPPCCMELKGSHAGISRSAAFVVALLMSYIPKEHDNSLITCMRRVKQKRPKVSINPGFVHQLRIWEAQLNRTDRLQLRRTPEYNHWKKSREMGIVAGTSPTITED